MVTTKEWAQEYGISVEDTPSTVEDYSEACPLSPREIAARAVILQAVVAVAFKVDPEPVVEWLHEQRVWDRVSPREEAFLLCPDVTEEDRNRFSWHQKKQTDRTRSSGLSILIAAPHDRGSGAREAGGLEPASPGTASARRIVMRSHPARPVPPPPAEAEPTRLIGAALASAAPVGPTADAPDPQPHHRAAAPKASRRQGGRS